MSRIHEALKKAAEERSTQLAAGLVAGVGETAEETRHSVTGTSEVGLPVIPTRLVPGGHQAMPLRYEELVMRCAHPEWRLDPLRREKLCRVKRSAVDCTAARLASSPFGRRHASFAIARYAWRTKSSGTFRLFEGRGERN